MVLGVIPPDGSGNQNLDTVEKVYRGWKERKLFHENILRNVDEHIRRIRSVAGFVPMSEADNQYALRKMEQDREGVSVFMIIVICN